MHARFVSRPRPLGLVVGIALGVLGLFGAGGLPSTLAADSREPTAPSTAEPVSAIVGRVLDHKYQPVAGARVGVANSRRGHIFFSGGEEGFKLYGTDLRVLVFFKAQNGKATGETVTDAEGRFEIKGVSPEAFRLIAYHRQRGCTVLDYVDWPSTGTELAVRLDPPTTIEGVIHGLPAQAKPTLFGANKGALLFGRLTPVFGPTGAFPSGFVSPQLILDAKGGFSMGPLPGKHEAWRLAIDQFVSENGFSAPLLNTVVPTQPGATNRFEFDLNQGESITGTLVGPDGAPLKNVSMTAQRTGVDEFIAGAVSDAKGNYRIGGLEPGKYRLEAKRWAKRTGPG